MKVNDDGSVNEEAKLPLDFSITKAVLSLFIGVILIPVIFLSAAKRYTQIPTRLQRVFNRWLNPYPFCSRRYCNSRYRQG
ncbi:MAG: hypothetical protein IPH45_19260 [Bacteroidales bacterium]|nr:hypothetical protein [Bacteroidales bacterium]